MPRLSGPIVYPLTTPRFHQMPQPVHQEEINPCVFPLQSTLRIALTQEVKWAVSQWRLFSENGLFRVGSSESKELCCILLRGKVGGEAGSSELRFYLCQP